MHAGKRCRAVIPSAAPHLGSGTASSSLLRNMNNARASSRGCGGVDPREAAGADVNDHLPIGRKRFRHRLHRQVSAEELGVSGVLAEDQAPNVRVQPVGADDDVEPAWRCVLEGHLAVGGDGRDRVAEEVLDVIAAGVVVDLAEIVAHDLHVPVGYGADDLGEIDADRPPCALAIHRQRCPFRWRVPRFAATRPSFPRSPWPAGTGRRRGHRSYAVAARARRR